MKEVINKHKELINDTCSRCGSKDHVQENGADWIKLLCRKCTQNDLKNWLFMKFLKKDLFIIILKAQTMSSYGKTLIV